MSPRAAAFRDIFLIYLFCLLLGLLTCVGKSGCMSEQDAGFLGFDGISHPVSRPLSAYGSKTPGKEAKTETLINKQFEWKDNKKISRKTMFHIPADALKSEIKKFGRPRSMTNSLFLQRRGFKIIQRRNLIHDRQVQERVITIVDYKRIYERNLQYFRPLTEALMTSAEINEETDPMPAFLSFVQCVPYKQPPAYYNGKFIGSFFVPLVTLYEQYGDCDCKSLLLAEFLGTLPDSREKTGMILIRGRGLSHALLGVKRKPLLGMTSLYFPEIGYFIVMETTRSGWAPGFLDRRIEDALRAGYFLFVLLN